MQVHGLTVGARLLRTARLLTECDDVRSAYWNVMSSETRAQLEAREQFIKWECARLVIDGKHIDLRTCPTLPRPSVQ